jgi:hypothetical protein
VCPPFFNEYAWHRFSKTDRLEDFFMNAKKQTRRALRQFMSKRAAKRIARVVNYKVVAYGVLAYFGLRFLNERGILEAPTGAVLGLVDRTIDAARDSLDLFTDEKTHKAS